MWIPKKYKGQAIGETALLAGAAVVFLGWYFLTPPKPEAKPAPKPEVKPTPKAPKTPKKPAPKAPKAAPSKPLLTWPASWPTLPSFPLF